MSNYTVCKIANACSGFTLALENKTKGVFKKLFSNFKLYAIYFLLFNFLTPDFSCISVSIVCQNTDQTTLLVPSKPRKVLRSVVNL